MTDTFLQTIFVPALVSIFATAATLYFKSLADEKTHKQKLLVDHELSEKRKIKESISKHKTPIINSFDALNHRIWNLGNNYKQKWHMLDGIYLQDDKYYFHSFVYMLGSSVCWADKIDRDMVYLDTTISDKKDLDFLKFCKFFNILLCQTSVYKGLDYDVSKPTDHFYRHVLTKEANSLLDSTESVISYSLF